MTEFARPLAIPEIILITPKKFIDERGFFSETYNRNSLADAGINAEFVQDNHSLSIPKAVIRGLHYQKPPFAQDKLVRVIRGSIIDVAVDIRKNSPTFGQHVSAILSAENWQQLWVPKGFAHGFCTLEPNTEVAYKVTSFYSADCDTGIAWNDPDLAIDWQIDESEVLVSEKDARLARLIDSPSSFTYEQL